MYIALGEVNDWTHANAVVARRGAQCAPHLDPPSQRGAGDSVCRRREGESGDVLWRFGPGGSRSRSEGEGELQYHQHAPEVQPDGTILLYDNGNDRPGTDPAATDPAGRPTAGPSATRSTTTPGPSPRSGSTARPWTARRRTRSSSAMPTCWRTATCSSRTAGSRPADINRAARRGRADGHLGWQRRVRARRGRGRVVHLPGPPSAVAVHRWTGRWVACLLWAT